MCIFLANQYHRFTMMLANSSMLAVHAICFSDTEPVQQHLRFARTTLFHILLNEF